MLISTTLLEINFKPKSNPKFNWIVLPEFDVNVPIFLIQAFEGSAMRYKGRSAACSPSPLPTAHLHLHLLPPLILPLIAIVE